MCIDILSVCICEEMGTEKYKEKGGREGNEGRRNRKGREEGKRK